MNATAHAQSSVQHVISDHAGTVLDAKDPEPSLTRSEEAKATEVFHSLDRSKQGLRLAEVQKALGEIGVKLDQETLAAYVIPFFEQAGLRAEEDVLNLQHYLELVGRVYAPGHKYGPRLRKACGRGDDERVRDLVVRGCNPRGTDGGGFNSLHYAAQYDRIGTIDLLLDICPDRTDELLNGADNSGWTPLMVAAAYGRIQALQKLLSRNARVEAMSAEGRTALHWAAAKGKELVVPLLVKAGLSADAQDRNGWTPIHCAMFHGHIKLAASLITDFNGDMRVIDNVGSTAEDYCSPEIWQGLLTEVERLKNGGAGKKKAK